LTSGSHALLGRHYYHQPELTALDLKHSVTSCAWVGQGARQAMPPLRPPSRDLSCHFCGCLQCLHFQGVCLWVSSSPVVSLGLCTGTHLQSLLTALWGRGGSPGEATRTMVGWAVITEPGTLWGLPTGWASMVCSTNRCGRVEHRPVQLQLSTGLIQDSVALPSTSSGLFLVLLSRPPHLRPPNQSQGGTSGFSDLFLSNPVAASGA
jgi:hypothetical protein